ncbi:exocyst complex component EXO70E2-like [Musa acuminata AAA Group]|uniref:exocyst complex component EXO70E2-like n=1 Tax=Musa acuminata AAA Group TaxID=214697 RepID=UPI0031DF98E7
MEGQVSVGTAQVDGRCVVVQKETQNLTDEMVEMIADIGIRYSDLTIAEEVGTGDIEEQLKELEKKILLRDSDTLPIQDQVLPQVSEYLKDVNEVWELGGVLRLLCLSNEDEKHNELLNFAEITLQMAMERLEDEFVQLLTQCCKPLVPDSMSLHSAEEDSMDNFSNSSFDEESVEAMSHSDTARESENVVIDLINHGLISDITAIANFMCLCNYEKECCQAYVIVRKDAVEECLSVLQFDRFNIEEVLKMGWNVLHRTIEKWKQAMQVFVRVCLARERHLCDLVFGELPGSIREPCFVNISNSSILQLLSIAMAIALAPRKPERLFQTLNTYEVLSDLLVDMEHFLPEDYGSGILTECHEVLLRLKESVSGTLEEFKYNIQSSISYTAFPGGGVHHLTKYVMNYIKALSAYGETLGSVLEGQQGTDQSSVMEDGDRETSSNQSPLVWHLKSVTKILEANLAHKSQLYSDVSLQSIFMMNNVCYMVDKVKQSDLRNFFGDEWIRAHIVMFQKHARDYERASWTSVLSFLKEEGICRTSSRNPSSTVLKDRFRGFNHAFEEVYNAQTAWSVPNAGLRDDLRISVSTKLIQAYRIFESRHAGYLDGERHREKYIKYSPDELEEYLLDLFAGSPRSLQSQRR